MASKKSTNSPPAPTDNGVKVLESFDSEGTHLAVVPIGMIATRPGENPNVVSDEQFKLLVEGISSNGFLQPVTVRPTEKGGYELIDGHHRLRAAKEIGLERIPCLVTNATDMEAMAEMLALNRLRGEMDLSKAARALQSLAAEGFPDLTLTGFGESEIAALLATVPSVTDGLDNVGADAGAGGDNLEPVKPDSKFSVRLLFDKEEDRSLIKAVALRFGPTVEAGLIALARAQPEG
jgi:hypothetical protein